MRNQGLRLAAFVLATFGTAGGADAAAPTCNTTGAGTAYCSYTGKVVQAYVNEANLIILYLDTNFTQAQITAVGITGVTQLSAVARRIEIDGASNGDTDFAKMLYSTMLTAKASDATVTVQMKTVYNGYLEIDKIWLK